MKTKQSPKHHLSQRILDYLSHGLHWFEVAMAGLTVVFVILGVVYLVDEMTHFNAMVDESNLHYVFEELLSDILLLVVGIELAIMLVRRTPESLVEVMFFVIARITRPAANKTIHFL